MILSTVQAPRQTRRGVIFGLLWACALLSVSAGCTSLGNLIPAAGAPVEERSAFDAARGQLPADSRGAEVAFQNFLERYPRSVLADDAAEQLAALSFAAGRQDDGLHWLGLILRRYPNSDREPAARLRLAQLEYARDQRLAARTLLSSLKADGLPLESQLDAERLRADLSKTPVERFENLSALRAALEAAVSGGRPGSLEKGRAEGRLSALDREIDGLIASAPEVELEETMRRLQGRAPAPRIALELCRRAVDAGQTDLAMRRIERTRSLIRTDAQREALDQLEMRLAQAEPLPMAGSDLPALRDLVDRGLPDTAQASGTIGVVLPLSGDFGSYGEASLRGILLATGLFRGGVDAADSGIRLVVRDSEGDPARAAAAVQELSGDPEIAAVIGPIFSAESVSAADAAERMGVPLVTLSTREDVAAGRLNAFRTRTTPQDEVTALVDHAFDSLSATRFAVLYPETRYGRGMRKLYWDAVQARGGRVVAASSYDADAVDFSDSIRDMIGYRFLTSLEKRALAEREDVLRASRGLSPQDAATLRSAAYAVLGPEGDRLPPIVDFDVLFIPDAADKIALIAPGLAFHEIRGIRLLGSNEWVDEELLRVGRQHVRGAVISTPFYLESDVSFVTRFVNGYRKAFGEAPDAYAAEAFDAANLVLMQMSTGRTSRGEIRDGLLATQTYPGATGVLTMHSSGNAQRRPFLLEVSGGRFRPLD